VAINPETELNRLDEIIHAVDGIVIMSVVPGFGGQEMLPESIGRVKALHAKYPELVIGVDGGVNKANIQSVFEAGASIVYIGTGLLKADNPQEEWQALNELAQNAG